MKAVLLLEDGVFYEGEAFGAEGEAFGEVVFNTSITGYQEILTDPSYKGQIVTMTYPLIGNYGVNEQDVESQGPWVEGFVVREASSIRSNWRASMDLDTYLKKSSVVGIQGIDTRALTRHLRINGAKQGVISSRDLDPASLARKLADAPRIVGVDLVKEVSCEAAYEWREPLAELSAVQFGQMDAASRRQAVQRGKPAHHVVVVDCGVKRNILRNLVSAGCRVTVVPASTTSRRILAMQPEGLVISNGPGDPEPIGYVARTVAELLGKLPIFGICMGQHVLGLAMGGTTFKLKFGHHGGNHPVKDLDTGRIAITSQNHGFNVDVDSIARKGTRVTHLNLYDKTVEGLENRDLAAFSVQYHPEASPGPHDAGYLFGKFVGMMEKRD
jgi:carbamoyl-phosphate synthase small subunit